MDAQSLEIRGSELGLPTKPERLIRQDEAARLLQVSPRTLEAWRYRGGGPRYVKLSARCVRYAPSDIEAWQQDCKRRHTSDDSGAS